MKRGIKLLLALALCIFACGALADDYGEAVIDAPGGWTYLYDEASTGSEVLGQYLTGVVVDLLEEPENGWAWVKINGRLSGYIKEKYLKTGAKAERVQDAFWTGEVQATNYARMRYGPSTEYQFACKVNDGAAVTIMGKTQEDWYYVRYKDEEGFISRNLVYTRGRFGSNSELETDDREEHEADRSDWNDWNDWNDWPVQLITPAPVRNWQDAYTDYLMEQGGENDTYALIYVNNDSIPELVIDSGVEAQGCRILTYGAGQANVLTTRRLGFTYIERGNRLCNSDGVQDSYYDDVYEIRDGRWVCIARGEYFGYLYGWNDILQRYVCRNYRWNGQVTDIAQYMVNLTAVYDGQRAIGVEEGYSKYAMLWKIGEMR